MDKSFIILIDVVALIGAFSSSTLNLISYNTYDENDRNRIFNRRLKLSAFTILPVAITQMIVHLIEVRNWVDIFNLIAICFVYIAHIYRVAVLLPSWNQWRISGNENLLKKIKKQSKFIIVFLAIALAMNFIKVSP